MKKYYYLFLYLLLSCNNSANKGKVYEKNRQDLCLLSLTFNPVDSLLTSDYISIYLTALDTAAYGSISWVIFDKIENNDRSFLIYWSLHELSSDSTLLIVNTNQFEDRSMNNDSIEHLLSSNIKVVTTHGDTVTVKNCK